MSRQRPPHSDEEPVENLESFLRRQDTADLVAVLLELAETHEAVRARLERMLLADRPDKLAAEFKKSLSRWKRSTRFYPYREAREFAAMLRSWLDQVARELLPKHPEAALSLFEAFIAADATWFEHADDSDGVIGQAVRAACRYWLQAAARCESSPAAWSRRLIEFFEGDGYGAREDLLRCADQVLDERSLRALVDHFDARLVRALESAPRRGRPPREISRDSTAIALLAKALRDPDIEVRATLRSSPDPNSMQRQAFAQAYLDAGRPADALVWLQDSWEHLDGSRRDLLAEALERLGRFDESVPIRQSVFEQTLSDFHFQRWLAHVPESKRDDAVAHARRLALTHANLTAAATLLLQLGDATAAEARLVSEREHVEGLFYGSLLPLAKALRAHECLRGETVVLRALLTDILDRADARAYGHAARYWVRLSQIAEGGVDLQPLEPHEEFAAGIRARHKRKSSLWARVSDTRRDRRDDADEDDS